MLRLLFFAFLCITSVEVNAQYDWDLPTKAGWNSVEEGDSIHFKIRLKAPDSLQFSYQIEFEEELNVHLDTLGNFDWIPSYDLVNRIEERKQFSLIISAIAAGGIKSVKELQFEVTHKNRPPIISSLPNFYVKQYSKNEYNLNKPTQVSDPDNDPIVFKPYLEDLPEGAMINESGLLSWKPSRNQFRSLKKTPIKVRFIVQDQPEKEESIGQLLIQATQLDLPPNILIVPSDSVITIKEDEVVNLNLYVTDPNGDDNVMDVGFLSNHNDVPKEALTKYTNTQWEFKWTPGYNFIAEEGKIDTISLTFFAVDDSGKKKDNTLQIAIEDAENIEKRDLRLYQKYRGMLKETMDLIAHLDENQKVLNKQLKMAKKGKKRRSIVSASLGAVTGISPVFLEEDPRNYVTGIGGTAVLTLGTLEATEVIGRSKDDILEMLKVNIDMRNLLQNEGDNFARRYALKSKRRDKNFNSDIDKLKAELNNKKLILLELSADWENPKKDIDKNIRKVFPDFNNEGFTNR
ncbi:MAG: hypothetical protein AAF693_22430 [Bacteroidota bacterium]